MRMRMTTLAVLVALAASPAFADRRKNFSKFDTNEDGKISRDEWRDAGGAMGNFDAMDCNKDGELTEQEFVRGTHEHNPTNCRK